MTLTTDAPPPVRASRADRRRRLKAVLAAGTVLGIGAAVTLAAWNDSEFAKGTFTAGTFSMEGAEDALGTSFTEHATAGAAATLSFSGALGGVLSPSTDVYAPFAVRLIAGTTNDAQVTFASSTTTGTITGITYGVKTVTLPGAAGCSALTYALPASTAVIPDGTALNSVGTPTPFTLTKGATAVLPGTPTYLCFKVSTAAIAQGQTATATWGIQATSQ